MTKHTKHLVQQTHFIARELYKQLAGSSQEDLALEIIRAAEELYYLHFNQITP